jgi:pyruvate ferredoxin oxidoreductase beta subunit
VTNVKKFKEIKPVTEYLKTQRRFAHLFKKEGGDEVLEAIQAIADRNVERFGMIR